MQACATYLHIRSDQHRYVPGGGGISITESSSLVEDSSSSGIISSGNSSATTSCVLALLGVAYFPSELHALFSHSVWICTDLGACCG